TYENNYIETLWWMLKELYNKGLLYKGYTIQPYSPAAGTGLSNHELNQPGCYRDVKDTTCVAQFHIKENEYFLAWTTTPWTLPSNTALAVGAGITYVKVACQNPYTGQQIQVILAECLLDKVMHKVPYEIVGRMKGSELVGTTYEPLMPWVRPDGKAFTVITGDFVTTEDGTGIVHIAPTFGADDDRVAKQNGIAPMLLLDKNGKLQPMVDRTGKFFKISDLDPQYVKQFVDEQQYAKWQGKFVKNAYDPTKGEKDETLDIEICMELKGLGKVFKIEKHTHNYPHCWRTDKPVLYYPLDSWFIKTTAYKERMIELNATIAWRPASTGEGRFGKWLENLVDWNLSRSRYWGTPLPIWATEDYSELKCIGSIEELNLEIEKSAAAGFMPKGFALKDLHRPYVDDVVLVSDKGQKMRRESDLIDVWFDSGAMPYAQMHFPFEGRDIPFPADFIAEGVDQTRGWFFTLHALAVMLFDSVAFKNIISNGLVLDKNGNKMSKRLGNAVDPFEALKSYGADAVRWYMIANSQPWDNLKFDAEGVDEVRRKFFGTLYNTYSFFALYANVDGFSIQTPQVPLEERPEIDRWVLSLLNTLIKNVTASLDGYDPTPAARYISDFVGENLSNWYVRLCRKRFWAGQMTQDKLSAYQTLYTCLESVSRLAAPFAPFITERLYRDLTSAGSVHLSSYPVADDAVINPELEERMELAQRATSMVLALRRKVSLRVRQPLSKMILPVLDPIIRHQLEVVSPLILSEVNVKEIEFLEDTTGIITKKIKPNFKALGAEYGRWMKGISAAVATFSQSMIADLEKSGSCVMELGGDKLTLSSDKFEITSEDMPGWLVATEGKLTIALDINLTDELRAEGIAREIVNRVQNLRKDSGFEVIDKILITLESHPATDGVLAQWGEYICSQTLSLRIETTPEQQNTPLEIDLIKSSLSIRKA
ncbi:MAG: isoleucine--tRNA ligase, partial [Mucinivorans sp.]